MSEEWHKETNTHISKGEREGGREGKVTWFVLVAVVFPALELGYGGLVLVQALLQEEAVERLARLGVQEVGREGRREGRREGGRGGGEESDGEGDGADARHSLQLKRHAHHAMRAHTQAPPFHPHTDTDTHRHTQTHRHTHASRT